MRMVKILLVLFLVTALFGIVGLYSQLENIGIVSDFFHTLMFQTEWLFYLYQIILAAMLILLLFTFLLVLFKPIRSKRIHVKKEIGQINLPIHTLEAIAKSSIGSIANAADTQVKIHLTKKHMADVEVIVAEENHQFLSDGHQIQERVKQALEQMAKIETNKIKVIFKKKKAETTILSGNKKAPRVI